MVKQPVTMTIKGEEKQVLMDHWQVCPCVEQERVERLIRSSQISSEFQKKTFDSFSIEDVHETIRDAYKKAYIYYAQYNNVRGTPNNGICLLGRPGCGKTHLLMAITNALLNNGVEVLYFPFVEGMEEIKADMKKEDVNRQRFEKMQKVEVLFIDDLFKPPSKPSEYEIRKMFEVINYRYLERKPVLISSELTINGLLDIDEALGSRIKEMCHDFRVEIKGGREMNYRLREDETA